MFISNITIILKSIFIFYLCYIGNPLNIKVRFTKSLLAVDKGCDIVSVYKIFFKFVFNCILAL